MGSEASIKITVTGIEKDLNQMVARAKNVRGFLNSVIYKQYQNAQRKRWITEGASEGGKWAANSPKYATWKIKQFTTGGKKRAPRKFTTSGLAAAGRNLMIFTGSLVDSVVDDPKAGHKKIVNARSIKIFTTVPYAKKVNEVRPFTNWSPKTINSMKRAMAKYIMGNK